MERSSEDGGCPWNVVSIPIHTVVVVATFHRRFTSAPTLQFAGKNAGNSACKSACNFAGEIATTEKQRAKLTKLEVLTKLDVLK
jgi:hypothetical protein